MTGRLWLNLAPLALLWACGVQDEAGSRYRVESGSGVALVFREPREGLMTMDAASAGGTFALRGNCIVVDVAGTTSTPVFPVPARYDPAARAIVLGGKSYALGRQWQLESASAGAGPIERLANASALPAACPKQYFYFGGITEQSGADRPG